MENKLSRLFDYQKYAGNSALADIINDVESRYPEARELSDDELLFVNAAMSAPRPEKFQRDTSKGSKK